MRTFLFLLLVISTPLLAQDIAVEKVDQRDIHFRGQGSNPWCFAFAEEQTIKDALCTGSGCATNAAQIDISIFDIAKAHKQWSQIVEAKSKRALQDHTRDIEKLFRGSGDFFVFQYLGIRSVRASECTLEKELFQWNRTLEMNPEKVDLLKQLDNFSMWTNWGKWDEAAGILKNKLAADMKSPAWKKMNKKMRDATVTTLGYYQAHLEKVAERVRTHHLEGLFNTLHQIHQEQNRKMTYQGFAEAVFDYRKCDRQIDVSRFQPRKLMLGDIEEIKSKIDELLAKKKSVSIGVCAEVLEKELIGSMDSCGSHAVTVKDKRLSGEITEWLVVDSAFFSERARNSDGSIWIPEHVVALAMSKHALRIQKIRDEFAADVKALEEQINGEKENLKSQGSKFFKDFDETLEKQGAIAKKNLKRYNGLAGLKRLFEGIGDNDPDDSAESDSDKAFSKKLLAMPFKTEQDVDAVVNAMRARVVDSMRELLDQPFDKAKTEFDLEAILGDANNIGWLE